MADETNNSGAAATPETVTTATTTGAGETAQTETTQTAGQAQGAQQTPSSQTWAVPPEFLKDGKILGKFDPNNPAEVLKAYQNLEKQFHQGQQAKRKSPTDIADAITGAAKPVGEEVQPAQQTQAQAAQMAQEAQAAQQQGGQAAEDAYWAQYGMTTQVGRAVAALSQRMAQQQIDQVFATQLQPLVGITNRLVLENAIQGLQNKYGDFDQHDQAISAYLTSDPEMSALVKKNPAKWLEKTYLMVRNVDAERKTKEVAAAATVAATNAEQQRQQTKAAAAVEPPGTRTAPTQQPDLADSWLESASQHLNRGQRLKL